MKFKVNIVITTKTLATYEVESESKEKLCEDLYMWSVEDLGTCVQEEQIGYDEKLDSVFEEEKKDA